MGRPASNVRPAREERRTSADEPIVGNKLEQYNVVITTFQTVASEHGAYETAVPQQLEASDSDDSSSKSSRRGEKNKAKKASHALFDVKWLRIVIG